MAEALVLAAAIAALSGSCPLEQAHDVLPGDPSVTAQVVLGPQKALWYRPNASKREAPTLSPIDPKAGGGAVAEPRWHWIWIVPAPDPAKGWTKFEAEASVRFDGTRFTATLSGDGDWQPELQVRGRITAGRARFIVTQLGTDASPTRYVGRYDRNRSKLTDAARGWGSDRISLSDGADFLAFYRPLAPTRP